MLFLNIGRVLLNSPDFLHVANCSNSNLLLHVTMKALLNP